MLFNSYIFILLFLPITLIGYYGLNYINKEKLATGFLVAMSLWFYGYNNINYLYVLIVSILLNYILVHGIRKTEALKKKLLFILGILLNLGIIFYFKYYDFFIDNMNHIFKSDLPFLRLALPLGISFYTFQQLSYVIDSYKNECEEYSFLEYASYVTFFPQLIAGPIVYHDELIPQFRKKENRRFNYESFSKGMYAFSLGLAKKVLIADFFSPIVAMIFDNSLNWVTTNTVILGMICYSLQLYFDFSGYCDMAYGIGLMFNVKLPLNFNSPYKAHSISDFWDRWHMTLTRFFTKYVYFPLGGSRKGRVRRDVNILIVFLLSGLWHGAAWTFILWGALHGILQVLDKYIGKIWNKIPKLITTPITFLIASYLWMIFRVSSFDILKEQNGFLKDFNFGALHYRVIEVLENTFEYDLFQRVGISNISVMIYLIVMILLLAVFFMKNTNEKVQAFKPTVWKTFVTVTLTVLSIISFTGVSEFLYFNF